MRLQPIVPGSTLPLGGSAAAGGGKLVHIATVTASNSASADFDGELTDAYDNYVIIGHDINPATDNQELWIRTDSNGGASYDAGGTDYAWAVDGIGAGGGTPDVLDSADHQDGSIVVNGNAANSGMGNAASEGGMLTLWICNPSGTVYDKLMMWTFCQAGLSVNNTMITNGVGRRSATAAIDSIQFLMSSGNLDGVFNLYGIDT